MNPQNLHAHEDRLLDFVYGELPVPEARAVEAHLQGCARCTQALDDLRGVRATMSQLSLEPAPDAGLESLLAYAQQSARRAAAGPAPRPSRWRRWMLPVVGLASVSTFGILALQAGEETNLTQPSLSQAAAEQAPVPVRMKDAAPAPASAQALQEASPKTPASRSPASQDRSAEFDQSMGAGPGAPTRAEGWEKAGSGGGLDARIVRERETEWKAKRGGKERARSMDDKALALKPEPRQKRAVASKDLDEEALAAPEGRMADSHVPKQAPPRDSLRLGGTSPTYDDTDEAGTREEAPAEAMEAQPQAGGSAYAQAAPATMAPASSATAPIPMTQNAGRGAAKAAESMAARGDFEAAPELSTKNRQKKGEAVSAPAMPPPPPQAPAAERRPTAAELSRRALEAFNDGDRTLEAGLLRSALAAGASRSERPGLLIRLCDAELALGRRAEGIAACNQALNEAPGSSAAQAARRRMSREATSLEAPTKPSETSK